MTIFKFILLLIILTSGLAHALHWQHSVPMSISMEPLSHPHLCLQATMIKQVVVYSFLMW